MWRILHRYRPRQTGGLHKQPKDARLRLRTIRAARRDEEAQPVGAAGLLQKAGGGAGGELRRAGGEKRRRWQQRNDGNLPGTGSPNAAAAQEALVDHTVSEPGGRGAGGTRREEVHAGASDRRSGLDGERGAGRVGAVLRRRGIQRKPGAGRVFFTATT